MKALIKSLRVRFGRVQLIIISDGRPVAHVDHQVCNEQHVSFSARNITEFACQPAPPTLPQIFQRRKEIPSPLRRTCARPVECLWVAGRVHSLFKLMRAPLRADGGTLSGRSYRGTLSADSWHLFGSFVAAFAYDGRINHQVPIWAVLKSGRNPTGHTLSISNLPD